MPELDQTDSSRAILVKYAAKILNQRPYFSHVLRQKLIRKSQDIGLSDSELVVDHIITDLTNSGYLDDLYLADAFTRRQLARYHGPRFIHHRLRFLGLDEVTIQKVLAGQASLNSQVDSINRYRQRHHHLSRRSLASKLIFRGYTTAAINQAFDSDFLED